MEHFAWALVPAVLVATIFQVALGAFWYSPFFLGKIWTQKHGFSMEESQAQTGKIAYVVALFIALVTSAVLAVIVLQTQAVTASAGAKTGFLCWLGFVATTMLSGVIWAKKPIVAYLIDVVFLLVVLTLNGAIIATFR